MKEAKVITISNIKGGVGKTVTALNIGAGLFLKGYKVLFIDLDAQSNLTRALGVEEVKPLETSLAVLKGENRADIARITTSYGDLLPANLSLASADLELNTTGKEYRLREALNDIIEDYDFIIIDTPPQINTLTINALTASTSVIIPAQADRFSIEGVQLLTRTLNTIRKYTNPGLTIEGIVITRYKGNTVLNKDKAKQLEEIASFYLKSKVFKSRIRENIAIAESIERSQPIYIYEPNSNGATDYKGLLEELIETKIESM